MPEISKCNAKYSWTYLDQQQRYILRPRTLGGIRL